MVSEAAMTEFSAAVQTPSMRRNSISWSSEVVVGHQAFGQLNTAGRPPTAPRPTSQIGTSTQAHSTSTPVQ